MKLLSAILPELLSGFFFFSAPAVLESGLIRATVVPVLDQNQDGTGHGFENCGFHALKNALLAVSLFPEGIPEGEDISYLGSFFQDRALFSKFYDGFCLPFLKGKKQGEADAALPLIEEVFSLLQNSSLEEGGIAFVQQGARALGKKGLLCLTLFSDGENVHPVFFTEQQMWEGARFFSQVVSGEPFVQPILIGDETLGHWYALFASRDSWGNRRYLCLDSYYKWTSVEGSLFEPILTLLESWFLNPKKGWEECFSMGRDLLLSWKQELENKESPSFLSEVSCEAMASSESNGSALARTRSFCKECRASLQALGALSMEEELNLKLEEALSLVEKRISLIPISTPIRDKAF